MNENYTRSHTEYDWHEEVIRRADASYLTNDDNKRIIKDREKLKLEKN